MNTSERWQQRFQNFEKAFLLLQEIMEKKENLSDFEPIVQEGIIQRFEYTFDIAWKTIKDKMEADGIIFEKIAPKYIFKTAFNGKYIDNSETWLEMANDRNLMSHTYDFFKLSGILAKLKSRYYPEIKKLYESLKE